MNLSRYQKILTSTIIIILILLFGEYTGQQDLLDTASRESAPVDYQIEKNTDQPLQQVLVLYSVPNFENSTDKIHNLKDILESHWPLSVTVENYTEFEAASTEEYDKLIFVEENHDTEAIALFADMQESSETPVYWIGCGPESSIVSEGDAIADTVSYKDESFVVSDSTRACNRLPSSTDTEILGEYHSESDLRYPAITRSQDGDIRFALPTPNYYQITSYSLPFLDTFHYFLGHHDESTNGQALLRLEDVNVHTYQGTRQLSSVFKYLDKENIPFHIAFIAQYVNPSENIRIHSDHSPRFTNTIRKAVKEGEGVLVQHGYTHQYGNEISGVGFEFWDGENIKPISFDSDDGAEKYAEDKISSARNAMIELGIRPPDIWETPHYKSTAEFDAVFNREYPLRYEHIPGIGELPFAVDTRDTIFIPENLGYVFAASDVEEKREVLDKLAVFEDPVASIFWHPWRDVSELQALTNMIQERGYEFVSAYDLLEETTASPSPVIFGSITDIWFIDVLIYFTLLSFVFGVVVYTRNVYQVNKHYRSVYNFRLPMQKVLTSATRHGSELPKLALFIAARNEGLVIENTLRRIAQIDYPVEQLEVYVIVDERELDDEVPVTTKEVAGQVATELHEKSGTPFIHIVEVPKWYSGKYGDSTHTYTKSTKGRALNYCLQYSVHSDVDMVGVLDADGRLHPDVLKEVAFNRIEKNSKLLQGPVLQINNFKSVSIVGIAAGLELALHHLTELPHRLKQPDTFQFLAGTNYFIDADSIKEVGGWDQTALAEDAELALRLYLEDGTVGEWLNAPELEQTPANFSVYKKQRERWVRGHLHLLARIRRANLTLKKKLFFYYRIFLAQFRFLFDIGLPIVSVVLIFLGAYGHLPSIFNYVSIFLFAASVFIWDTYGYMYRKIAFYIESDMTVRKKLWETVRLFFFLPILIVIQSIPRMIAVYNSLIPDREVEWYKTERTPEEVLSAG